MPAPRPPDRDLADRAAAYLLGRGSTQKHDLARALEVDYVELAWAIKGDRRFRLVADQLALR